MPLCRLKPTPHEEQLLGLVQLRHPGAQVMHTPFWRYDPFEQDVQFVLVPRHVKQDTEQAGQAPPWK